MSPQCPISKPVTYVGARETHPVLDLLVGFPAPLCRNIKEIVKRHFTSFCNSRWWRKNSQKTRRYITAFGPEALTIKTSEGSNLHYSLLKLTLHRHLPKSNNIFPENPVCLSVIVLRGPHVHIDFIPQRKPNNSLKVWGVRAVSLLVQWNPCSDFSYFPRTKQRALQIIGDGSWEKRSILSAVRSHSGDNILMEELGCEFSTWLKEKCPVSGSSHRDGF